MKKNTHRTFNVAYAFIFIAGLYGFFGVLVGAMTGHSTDFFNAYLQMAEMYVFVHTLAISFVATILLCGENSKSRALIASGVCFALGLPIFSGFLFYKALDLGTAPSVHKLFFLMPVGGSLLLLGWIMVVAYAIRRLLLKQT